MICVSISEPSAGRILAALEGVDFAEVRIDGMKSPSEADMKAIFGCKAKLIATCRPGVLDEEKRKRLLLAAISSGAAYVDIEVEGRDPYKKGLVEAARKSGCSVIVSYHNNSKTPHSAELSQVVEWCFDSGADIAKIACKANSLQDNARLLGLLDSERKIIVIGMGGRGRITRIAAPLLGSPFTFASSGKGKETAEGQIDAKELGRLAREMGDG